MSAPIVMLGVRAEAEGADLGWLGVRGVRVMGKGGLGMGGLRRVRGGVEREGRGGGLVGW